MAAIANGRRRVFGTRLLPYSSARLSRCRYCCQDCNLHLGNWSIVWRRTKFSALRLKDIAGLQGATGLIGTLEKTTLQVALIAATIVAVGFIATVLTGNEFYTYAGRLIGLVVLLISYPTRSSWTKYRCKIY